MVAAGARFFRSKEKSSDAPWICGNMLISRFFKILQLVMAMPAQSSVRYKIYVSLSTYRGHIIWYCTN
jgi:hypothetical protein